MVKITTKFQVPAVSFKLFYSLEGDSYLLKLFHCRGKCNYIMSPDFMLEVNLFSLYLFWFRLWEMISDLLFNRFLSGLSDISSFSVKHKLQCFEIGQ